MLSLHPLRTRLVAIAAIALAIALAPAGAAEAAPGSKERRAPAGAAPVKADRDGDKVLDDLEARIGGLGPDARVSTIVTLSAAATTTRVRGLERAVGAFAVSHRFSIIDAFAATLTKGQIRALAQRSDIVRVEENSRVRAWNDGAQSSFGVAKARADSPSLDGDADGNASAYSSADLVAAVIDTGIDAGHVDLDEGKVLAFKDFVNGRTAPYDDNGHGTHIAGTIAGDGDGRTDGANRGVAPAAGLVGVKVLDANGGGTMADVTAAIDWIVENRDVYGIEVINLSLGASGCADGTDATSVAADNAHAAGLLVAVAAGNDGPGTCTIGAPGAARSALTVGAMADTTARGFSQAYFSSRGPTADGRIKPDVSAPGVAITSAQAGTASGYVAHDGTSMATPFVTGVALLMRDANPSLTAQQVKDAVRATAIDWGRGGDNRTAGSTGPDIDYGAGRLDAYAAIAAAGAPLVAPPAVPARELREGSLSASGAYVDYKLDVADTAFPVAATLVIAGLSTGSASRPDFDLYLYDPAGTLVARAENTTRQEEVGFLPTTTGTYTLRVRSYEGSGPFFLDASAGFAPAGVDAVAPTVTAVAPAAGAAGVAASTNVSATFSEPMDAPSAEAAFTVVKSSDGAAVSGSFTWSGDTLVFDPSSPLASGTEYTATITAAAKDEAGNALAAATTWKFETATAVTAYPSSTTISYGKLRSGDASRLTSDDDSYYQVSSTTSGTRVADWYGRVKYVANSLTRLTVTYKGKSSASCSQVGYVYNWTNGHWVKLDSRTVGTSESGFTVAPGGTLANYVSGTSGDGDVAIRVRCVRGDSLNFFVSGDLMKIAYAK